MIPTKRPFQIEADASIWGGGAGGIFRLLPPAAAIDISPSDDEMELEEILRKIGWAEVRCISAVEEPEPPEARLEGWRG